MARTILHLDLDAFFCAVEMQRDPKLIGQPFAVGGKPDQRGVVASCSYPARRFGVHSAMPMGRALQLCPRLIIVPPNFKAYGAASRGVMAYLHQITPLVEQVSIDEAFLDVTGLPGGGEVIAKQLQAVIRDEMKLPCSFGVATNKLVAKIANNIGKSSKSGDSPPNAIKVVPPGQEAAFLAPLPISELWGVGPKTAERLINLRVRTIGDAARMNEKTLVDLFGKNGADIYRHARGIDDRPVETEHETKSISREVTFTRDVRNEEALKRTLRKLSDGVGWRLRKENFTGTTVKVKLRWADFTTLTRQITLPKPVNQDTEIYTAALEVFEETWLPGRAVRLIGVGVSGLETTGKQLSLWEEPVLKQERRLQSALDKLRERFGEDVVQRGIDLKDEE